MIEISGCLIACMLFVCDVIRFARALLAVAVHKSQIAGLYDSQTLSCAAEIIATETGFPLAGTQQEKVLVCCVIMFRLFVAFFVVCSLGDCPFKWV